MRALVTGGGSGIGLAIARHLQAAGARVHVCDVSSATIDEATAKLPGLTASVADVAVETDVERLFADV